MIRTMIATSCVALVCAMVPRAAWPVVSDVDYQRCEALQDHFIDARARQDTDAMAAVFAQDAIRVTPDGVFQGRDAIRRNLDSVAAIGLHDFTAQRTILRREGDLLLAAGTWHAKLGELSLNGYYSALLSCVSNHQEILEETTNVAAPPH
jgi:hypothetical protein